MFDRAKHIWNLSTQYAALIWFAAFRTRRNSLKGLAASKVASLLETNPGFAAYQVSRLDNALRRLDADWPWVVWGLLSVTAGSSALGLFLVPPIDAIVDIRSEIPIDVSNFHSISTTVQATVLALIIPLAVVLHEFVLTGRRLTKHATSFFLKGSKVALITTSSVAYLAWVAVFEAAAPFMQLELHPVAAGIETIWLVANLLLIGRFMLRAYRMLNRNEFDAEIRRHLFRELYPRELEADIFNVSYLALPGEDHQRSMDDVRPTVSVWVDREGRVEVEKYLPRPGALKDVDRRVLRQLFKIWCLRNSRPFRRTGRRVQGARLSILPHLGQQAAGSVSLLASTDAKPLNFLERVAARRAFRFGPPQRVHRVNTKETLEVLADNAVKDLMTGDYDQFEQSVQDLVDIHGELLALAETVDEDGCATNLATTEKGFFARIYETWPRVYSRVFEAALRTVDTDRQALGRVSYVGSRLASHVIALPSKTSLSDVVTIQAQLHYRLSDWWENQADQQGLARGIETPSRLKPPAFNIYQRCLRTLAGDWDELLTDDMIKRLGDHATWSECRLFYPALLEHLTSTSVFIAKSCLAGDVEGAMFWATEYRRWRKAVNDMVRNSHVLFNLRQEAHLSAASLNAPWEAVVALLRQNQDYEQQSTPCEVFRHVLLNVESDLRLVLTAFVHNWNGENVDASALAVRVARSLASNSGHDEDADHDGADAGTMPLADIHRYLAFLMRSDIVQVGEASHGATIEGFADRIKSLTSAPLIAGRIYTSWGSSPDAIEDDILLLAATVALEKGSINQIVDRYGPLFSDHGVSGRAADTARQNANTLGAFDVKRNVKRYAALVGAKTAGPARSRELRKKVADLIDLFTRIGLVAGTAQRNRVVSLPISEKRLRDIAAAVPEEAIKKETGPFPLGRFKHVVFSKSALERCRFPMTTVSRADVVEAPDVRAPSLGNVVAAAVRQLVGPVVVIDIVNASRAAGKLETIRYDGEQAFADSFLEVMSRPDVAEPMLLVPNANQPEFMRRWQRATWMEDVPLPHRIAVTMDGGGRLRVNGVPIHAVDIGANDMFLMSSASLEKLEFRVFDEGGVVEIAYDQSSTDPASGTLVIEFERRVSLGGDYKVFHFRPK